MNISDIILTGVALAMDAFALTIANCSTYKKTLNKRKEWSMPATFAAFQFLMPVIGFYVGSLFAEYLQAVSGFVSAGVFLVLSLKIVFDNVKELSSAKNEKPEKEHDAVFSLSVLLIQGVATSIDALLIGAGDFAFSLSSPFIASLIVGAITFVTVVAALLLGKYVGKIFGKYAQWVGAIILFALAIKNLVTALI